MDPEDESLAPARRAQRLAYQCAVEVAGELRDGDSERDAAAALDRALRARGVRHYFHAPFAWFGDRTAFRGFLTPLAFFPTERRLEPGMAGILDVAPALDGQAVDIGYAFAHGENRAV